MQAIPKGAVKADSLCQYLDWDSQFFGYRIARVTVNQLTHDTIGPIMNWCTAQDIDCLYFLSDVTDANTTRLAEDNGFQLVDIRVTLDREVVDMPAVTEGIPGVVIRQSTSKDVPILKSIATSGYHDTRFYYDLNFPIPLCNLLYETWIEKSCRGYADTVLVVEVEGLPVGYISCHLVDQARGQIGLVGVSSHHRDRGLGNSLLDASLRWFAAQGRRQVTVVTQGRNLTGQRMYQKCGFLTRSVQLWYHRWFR
jgi:dTDP-4-amino-4,6-dideoxy-D-galactose acyltransferase